MHDAVMTTDHRQAPAGDALGMSRTWLSPRLAVLGEVRSLTEGGSAGSAEPQNNMDCDGSPPKAMC